MPPSRPRLTYANVMSTLAVAILVAGGVGYAAVTLPANSVGTKQIKKNAVTGAKVKDGSLAAADLSAAARASLKGQAGAAGAPGATGAAGPTGATGAAGAPGAQGVPGPTASAYAATSIDTVLSPGGGFATTIRLTTAGTTTGSLVLDEAMRVFILAEVTVSKGTGVAATVGNAECRARWASVGGSFSTLTPSPSVTFPDLPAGTAGWGVVPVNTYVDLAAGTYDFDIQCSATNSAALGTAQLTATDMALSLIAAAQ